MLPHPIIRSMDDGISNLLDGYLFFGSEVEMSLIEEEINTMVGFGTEWIIRSSMIDMNIWHLQFKFIFFGMLGDGARETKRRLNS